MLKNPILSILLVTLLISCNQDKIDQLHSEIDVLNAELEECQNGAAKLLSGIKLNFKDSNYTAVKSSYENLKARHPETEEFKEAEKVYLSVISIEEQKQKELDEKKKEEEAERHASLKKLRKNFDDVSGVNWYKQPYFTHYTNTFLTSVYMGQRENSSPWLRLQMSYAGDDWIFFEKAYLSYDGNTEEIFFDNYREKESDHDGGQVWEWIDVSVDESLIPFLRELSESKNAKMRFVGKYSKTRNLTYNERRGIKLVLQGYDALN